MLHQAVGLDGSVSSLAIIIIFTSDLNIHLPVVSVLLPSLFISCFTLVTQHSCGTTVLGQLRCHVFICYRNVWETDLHANSISWWPEFFQLRVDISIAIKQVVETITWSCSMIKLKACWTLTGNC
jgi:hypothetical protein